MRRADLYAFIASVRSLRKIIDDGMALSAPAFFPSWDPETAYASGDRVKHDGVLYRCLQDHDSQAAWNPEDASSLWARVLIPDPAVIPEWVQPDSTNPYMAGDRVTYNEKTWESVIDNNVWAPGVYGWTEVTE